MAERFDPWSEVPFVRDCESLVEWADSWIDGDLTASGSEKVELHIATCLGCASYVTHLRSTAAALGSLDEAPAPEPVRAGLLEHFRRRHSM
jgi:anti-sigma factor RsiW